MRSSTLYSAALTVLALVSAVAQGTFLFDQQSSIEGHYLEGATGNMQAAQPFGQSFTPDFSSIGFIRLVIFDGTGGAAGSGTLSINLRAGSITGPILGTTDPVVLPPAFSGLVNFYFSAPISLTPHETYAFQPVVLAGSRWGTFMDQYNYPGGSAFSVGSPLPTYDLWFREGIVVPEPSASALAFLAGAALTASRYTCRRPEHKQGPKLQRHFTN